MPQRRPKGFPHAPNVRHAAVLGHGKSLMDLAHNTLEKKRVFVGDALQRGLYPYTKRYLHDLRNHFSTIGVNGMNEMVRNFSKGQSDLTQKDGIAMSASLLDHMRKRLREFQERSGSPAEGATYRFAREDHKHPEQ